MDIAAQSIEGGFADPVFNAQTVFRAVMNAMARPGSVQPLPAFARPPAPLSATAGAIAL
ncbi:MAG: carbon-phosphorus lyase subunit PhnH, partial [Mesorhizobium sp.]